jgi:ribosomal protein S18 acetylase RimI-like enzyme
LADKPDPVVIRDGEVPDDIERCADIWVRAIRFRDGTVDARAMAQRVRSAFDNPIVRFAVATSPRSGFALVESGRPNPTEALLRFLAVDPDASGIGVGTALLDDAVERARVGGCQSISLEVRTTNARAIALYTRRGFEPFGESMPHPLGGDPMQSYRLALG